MLLLCALVLFLGVGATVSTPPTDVPDIFASKNAFSPAEDVPYGWSCESVSSQASPATDHVCVKRSKYSVQGALQTHAACQLTCGQYGALWPRPQAVTLGGEVVYFRPQNVHITDNATGEAKTLLDKGVAVFLDNLNMYHPNYTTSQGDAGKLFPQQGGKRQIHSISITVIIASSQHTRVTLEVDESYKLSVSTPNSQVNVLVTADTYFGARHALETLSQLIDYDHNTKSLQIVSQAEVTDHPTYPYRGILLDTSRNFVTIPTIKRTLDGMAATKLNTFHWHITDSHSFPMVMPKLPEMTHYGAYSPAQVYHPEEIRAVVEYGRVRGIRVLPEFDAPAHVGHGWEWQDKSLGNLTVCLDQEPWQSYCVEPPCGQLNLANPAIYGMLRAIYQHMLSVFGPLDLFHYGGDEVNLNCWNSSAPIVDWMKSLGHNLSADSYYQEWSNFQTKADQMFKEANGGVSVPGILWTSHLTEKGRTDRFLDRNKYIIQIWSKGTDPLIKELLEKKFRVIFSNYDAYYLDCGFGAWVGSGNNWCSPYKGWQTVYDNSPLEIAKSHTTATTLDPSLILGGEVALWTEQADDATVDSRIWPRASALGERLWTEPTEGWLAAEYRMVAHRRLLVRRGLGAERLQPEWCRQNEGLCYVK